MSEMSHPSQEAATPQKKPKAIGSGTVSFREGVVSPIFQSIKTFLVMHAAVLKPELAAQAGQQGGRESEDERRRQEDARIRNAESSQVPKEASAAQLLEMYTKAQGKLTEEQLKQVRSQLEMLTPQKPSQVQAGELPKAA